LSGKEFGWALMWKKLRKALEKKTLLLAEQKQEGPDASTSPQVFFLRLAKNL
jgi:hypothetical protein